MHEGGFSIAKNYLDRWYFRRPDGQAVPHCGYRPEDRLDDDIDGIVYTLVNNPSAEGYHNKEGLPTIPLNVADRGPTAEGLPTLPLMIAERGPPAYLM